MASGRDLSIQVLQSQIMEAIRSGDFATAHRYCQNCLQRNAVDPVSLHLQGVICLEQGRFADAQVWVKRALDANPRYAQAYNTLGVIADRSGKKAEALQAFQQSIRLFPEDPDVLKNLAMAHFNRGELQQAKNLLKKGLSLNPNHPGLLNSLGLLYVKRKQFEPAQQAYEKVIAQSPKWVEAHFNRAWVLEQQQQFEEARRGYERVLELNPKHCRAHYALSSLRQVKANDSAFGVLERLKRSQSLSRREESDLYFALAKMYDDIGNYDAAFLHYQFGNEAWQKVIPHDAQSHRRSVEQLIEATPASAFEKFNGPQLCDRPIFVVGMPGAGTTLVEEILAGHPAIQSAGELEWVGRLSDHCLSQKSTIQDSIQAMTVGQARAYGQEYLRRLSTVHSEANRVIDTMPDNFQSLWFIAKLFPQAKVLHVQRHPLDTCVACFTTHFVASYPWSSNLKQLGMYYADYRKLMAHWNSVLPIDMLEVDYEILVSHQEAESRRMIEFLELSWDDQCLEFDHSTRNVSTTHALQVQKPIDTSSIDRWKRYEVYLDSLFNALEPY